MQGLVAYEACLMTKATLDSNRFSRRTLRLGTRGSALALAQAELTKAALAQAFPALEVEVCIIKTTGDINLTDEIAKIGGKAVFTKEIDDALINDRIDIAVHSLKDVPAVYPDALRFCAVLPRANAHDVLIAEREDWTSIAELPQGAVVGTSSPRRAIMVKRIRPDITTMPIRGNVQTRLNKLKAGDFDAILLARAGLDRLGMSVGHNLSIQEMVPAVGQGIVAIQCRTNDAEVVELMQTISHAPTHTVMQAERGLLETLNGTCQSPIAAHAVLDGDDLHLTGFIASTDGKLVEQKELRGPATEAYALGVTLAKEWIAAHGTDFYK